VNLCMGDGNHGGEKGRNTRGELSNVEGMQ